MAWVSRNGSIGTVKPKNTNRFQPLKKIRVNIIPLLRATDITLKQQATPYSKLTNQSANAEYYVPDNLSPTNRLQPSNPINQTDAHQNQKMRIF
jgi:hypothetical protein